MRRPRQTAAALLVFLPLTDSFSLFLRPPLKLVRPDELAQTARWLKIVRLPPRMQASPGQGVNPASTQTGAGRYIRGDLRERPAASSVAIALFGMCGAIGGGVIAGGLEGVLLGSGILWMVGSFGDVIAERVQLLVARRREFEAQSRRARWVARAESAENALSATLKTSPVSILELRRALGEARLAGVEMRGPHLTQRAAALLELLERPLPPGDSRTDATDAAAARSDDTTKSGELGGNL